MSRKKINAGQGGTPAATLRCPWCKTPTHVHTLPHKMREAILIENPQRYPHSSSEFARTDFGKKWGRKWHFTIFPNAIAAWGDQVIDSITRSFRQGKVQRACAGWETCPNTNRLHLQGFVELPRKRRARWVMELLGAFEESVQTIPLGDGSPWPHITPHQGASLRAWRYCRKDSPDPYTAPGRAGMFWSIGEEPAADGSNDVHQGRRRDIATFVEDIQANPHQSTRDLVDAGHANILLRYPQGARQILAAYQQRRERGDRVYAAWLHGPSGTGKSHTAYEKCIAMGATDADIYYKMPGKWWEGYKGEKYVIFDDFRPTSSFTFDMLLRTIDSYRCPVEMKGGSTFLNLRFAFFTSVFRWDDERMIAYGNHEAIEQLGRRITETFKFRGRTTFEKGQNIFPPCVRDMEGTRPVPAQAEGFVAVTPDGIIEHARPRDPVATTLVRTDTLSDQAQRNQLRNTRRRLF